MLCAATSNCELVCAKLGSSAVFVSCASTKRSDCRVSKFYLAGSELMDLLKLVVGGKPYKNFGNWCCARTWRAVLCGKRCVTSTVGGVGQKRVV